MTSPSPRPAFNSYALPLQRRREGSATAVSFVVHVTIALLVLWRGAVLFETGGGGGPGPRGGGGGGGRPAVSWVALPLPAAAQQEASRPTPPPPPAVTVPTVASPIAEPVKLDVPPPPALTLRSDAVGTGAGTTGGPGQGPGSGGGSGTGAGSGAGPDAGPGSGGAANDIFGPTSLLMPLIPVGAPPDDKRKHEVRFWIRNDGKVTRIEVMPPIKDSGYRRRFMDAMWGFRFSPARTRDNRPIDYVYSIMVTPP